MMSTDRPDKTLLAEYRKDPGWGFRQIVRAYQERLYFHIRRMVILHADADDVLQNTFVKAWKGLPGFQGESSLYTWLYRIATNEALAFIQKKKKHRGVSLDDLDSLFLNSIEGDYFFDGDQAQRNLLEAMGSLPEKQRLVFQMKYFDEMKYEDISAVLNTSVGALKASYHHAVQKIRKNLAED